MATRIIIPTALRQYTDGHEVVDVPARNVGEALTKLVDRYPSLKKNLYTDDGKLRSFVNVYKGDSNIKDLNGLETDVQLGDELMIVPSIAGGAVATFGEM